MFGGTIKLNPVGLFVVFCVALVYLFLNWKSSASHADNVSLKRLLTESILAAERGGVQVARVHEISNLNTKSKGLTKEGEIDPVTNADLKSHRAIRASLLTAFKGYDLKLVSEEHEDDDGKDNLIHNEDDVSKHSLDELNVVDDDDPVPVDDLTVWIDPLDATKEFTENLLQYVTVLVCIAYKGEPVIGVIHRPFQHETFWAWTGKGQSKNIETHRYKSDTRGNESAPYVIVSRSHPGKVEQVARSALSDKAKIISAGGAGYKVLQILGGSADVYVHITLIKKWDICAGNALLNAVGGQMTTSDGEKIDYSNGYANENRNGLVAAISDHKKYVNAFKPLFAKL